MAPRDGVLGLRRNGKQQACEPCRKGKLACDHAAPFCGRCVRRQITSRCIYHPAPMTRVKYAPAINPPPSPHHTTPSISSDQTSGPGQSPQDRMAAPFRPQLNHHQSSVGAFENGPHSPAGGYSAHDIAETLRNTNWYGRKWEEDAVFPRSARYYGPTSFSSVFTENDLLDNIGEQRMHPSNWPFGQPLLGRDRPSAPTVRMNQVIRALWNIPSREVCESLMSTFQSDHSIVMNEVFLGHNITTLWSTFGEQLAVPRTSEKLTPIAETMFMNEEKALLPAPDDGIEWLNTFTGANLRFEMLGLFFCFIGSAYHALLDGDPRFSISETCGMCSQSLLFLFCQVHVSWEQSILNANNSRVKRMSQNICHPLSANEC